MPCAKEWFIHCTWCSNGFSNVIVDRAMAPDSSPSVRKGVGRAYLEHIVGNHYLDPCRYSAERAKGDNRVFCFMRQSNFGRFKLFTLAKDFDETTRYEVLTILDFYVKDLGFGVDNRRQWRACGSKWWLHRRRCTAVGDRAIAPLSSSNFHMRSEILEETLEHSAHLTSFDLLSWNHLWSSHDDYHH